MRAILEHDQGKKTERDCREMGVSDSMPLSSNICLMSDSESPRMCILLLCRSEEGMHHSAERNIQALIVANRPRTNLVVRLESEHSARLGMVCISEIIIVGDKHRERRPQCARFQPNHLIGPNSMVTGYCHLGTKPAFCLWWNQFGLSIQFFIWLLSYLIPGAYVVVTKELDVPWGERP